MKVKMWSRRLPGIPQQADNAPDSHSIALPYTNAARLKVLIKRVPPVAEIEGYVIATRIFERRSLRAFHYMRVFRDPIPRCDHNAVRHGDNLGPVSKPISNLRTVALKVFSVRVHFHPINCEPAGDVHAPVNRV